MKKNRPLFIAVISLCVLAVFYIAKNRNSTVKKELRDFAVKDTASVSKIFLADRKGKTVTLSREKNGEWLVNGKYHPRQGMVKSLLTAMNRLDVRTKVAKAAYNNVIKTLASTGIKCEIYTSDTTKPEKVYYVGGQTEDALGTFMMMENSSTPFIMEIRGFNGYLTPRYATDENVWKETIIFSYEPSEIKSLEINYANFPQKSFRIEKQNNSYTLSSPADGKTFSDIDSTGIENYLVFYRNVPFEAWEKNISEQKKDSLLSLPPAITIKISGGSDPEELQIYPMPISERSITKVDSLGQLLKYDLDKLYGYIKPRNELVIIQHYTFDRLLRQLTDFQRRKPTPAVRRN
jgi:hypothetical protein